MCNITFTIFHVRRVLYFFEDCSKSSQALYLFLISKHQYLHFLLLHNNIIRTGNFTLMPNKLQCMVNRPYSAFTTITRLQRNKSSIWASKCSELPIQNLFNQEFSIQIKQLHYNHHTYHKIRTK